MNGEEKDTMPVAEQAGAEEVEETGAPAVEEAPEATGEGDEAPVVPVVKDPEAEGKEDAVGGEEMGGEEEEEGKEKDEGAGAEKDDAAVTE